MEHESELLQAIQIYMKWIISRYEHDLSYLPAYTDDYVLYDRSEVPLEGSIIVPNVGSDIYDKLTYIVDNYASLPDVAIYTKANIFNYISKEEFEEIKDNKTFTPLLTKNHKTYMPVCFYDENGMYNEINNRWYLATYPCKSETTEMELMVMLGLSDKEYIPFAPGSNYLLPKENILKHSKEFYEKLRSYLEWDRYPGEAQIMERGLYILWS